MADEIIEMLSGGDLRSDARAHDVIRARAAHALEKVSRVDQGTVKAILPRLIDLGACDAVPMMRWHVAMILGNLRYEERELSIALEALFSLLGDSSAFVRNWAIVSLCVLGRDHQEYSEAILEKIGGLRGDEAASVRSRVTKAIQILGERAPIPRGWVKARGASLSAGLETLI